MNLQLKNKHVVISGGSSGIGFACALEYLREGAIVSIISRNPELLSESHTLLIKHVPDSYERLFKYHCDLSDANAVVKIINTIEESSGPIDILVNSLGVSKKDDPFKISTEDWGVSLHSKYFPYMNVITPVINKMKDRGHGSIVNIAGIGGKIPRSTAIPRGVASSAIMLASVGLAHEFGRFGIRVNVVNPDIVLTGNHLPHLSLEERVASITMENAIDMASLNQPFGRVALAQEVADVVVFLSSPRASYISGVVLPVDGAAHPMI